MGSAADRITIEPYAEADSEECLAMERRAPQGRAMKLSFRRPTFHRRAENFDDRELLVARLDGRIVGVTAVAFKDVVLLGRAKRAAFYFDLRVDPEFHRQGIATRLAGESAQRASKRVDLGYTYAMADNRAMKAMTGLFDCWNVAGFRYLVLPTYRERAPRRPVQATTLSQVHDGLLATAPPFDFYTDPRVGGRTDGHVASWMIDHSEGRAGASVWDARDILQEVVEGLPWKLRTLGALFRSKPMALLPHPHMPQEGEALRSWYLFDVYGTAPELVVDVVRHVITQAREAGIDFLYVPWVDGDLPWVNALGREVPKLFWVQVPYRLLMGPPLTSMPFLSRFYVDVRDL